MTLRADKIKTRVKYRIGEKVWLYIPQRSTKVVGKDEVQIHLAKKLKSLW